METKVLTIIIPVYNSEKYLRECLDSILNQNTDKSIYEIICVDDGSTDSSNQILQEYVNKYDNLKVISKVNGGASSARNLGIQNATGKYVWFIDSDDYIYDNVVNKLISFLKNQCPDIVSFSLDSEKLNDNEDFTFVSDYYMVAPQAWANIVLLDIIKNNNIYFNELVKYGEDTLFWYTVIIYSPKVYFLEQSIYFYRDNEQSIMNTLKNKEDYDRRIHDDKYILITFEEYINKKLIPFNRIIPFTNMIYYLKQRILYDNMPRS